MAEDPNPSNWAIAPRNRDAMNARNEMRSVYGTADPMRVQELIGLEQQNRQQAAERVAADKAGTGAGVSKSASSGNGASEQAKLIGEMFGPQEPAPEQYVYKELSPGETNVAGQDIMMDNVDGKGGSAIRRKKVNPEYGKWVSDNALKFMAAQQLIGMGEDSKQSKPSSGMMGHLLDAMDARRSASSPQEVAAADEKINQILTAEPALRGSMQGTGGAGGGETVADETLVQDIMKRGHTREQALKMIANQAQGQIPPPVPQSAAAGQQMPPMAPPAPAGGGAPPQAQGGGHPLFGIPGFPVMG